MVSFFFKIQRNSISSQTDASIDTAADEGSSSELPTIASSKVNPNSIFAPTFKVTSLGSYNEAHYSSLLHYRAYRCLADDDIEKILANIQRLAHNPSQEKLLAKLIIALVNRGDSQLNSSKQQELVDKLTQKYFPKEVLKLAPRPKRAMGA